jgi:DNA-directed RNA polymerase specialized sigma24 family protein
VHGLTRGLLREASALTQFAFTRLLAWLDDGVESHGERYVEIRRRLVAYFERRNRSAAEELADETLNRIARTLEAGAIAVRPPARYCYVIAKFVLLEDFRRQKKQVPMDASWHPSPTHPCGGIGPDDAWPLEEQRLECLERCVQELKPPQRELIVEYYADTGRRKIERRRALARRLGISMNALAIRACRIREGLMACVEARRDRPRVG